LADELKRQMPDRVNDVRLIQSSGGVFEIRNGDQVIFSKKQLGRFPNEGEIARNLQA
jgi:selenoprotein W-related protein